MIIFIFVIMIGVGITMFFQPNIIWKITESWNSKGAYGPSDLYKISTKIGGAIITILGLWCLITAIFFV